MNNILKNIKGYLYSLVLFFILTLIISSLIKFTSIPESWSIYYVIFALCTSCLLLGVYSGYQMKKKGFVYGALSSAILLLIIFAITMMAFTTEIQMGLGLIKYLVCVFFGSVGGMIGVNVKI